MPTRYLKESICTSDNLAQLSANAERLWYRLIVKVDDFGRFDARIAVIRAGCFPLQLDGISEGDVSKWLTELQRAGLVLLYSVDNRPYLEIVTFSKHNHPRAKVSKCPAPRESAYSCMQLPTDASKRLQIPPESESESESQSEAESETNTPPPPPTPVRAEHASAPVWEAWMQAHAGSVNGMDSEQLGELEAQSGADATKRAIEYGNAHKDRPRLSIAYVSAILAGWQRDGTLDTAGGNGSKPPKQTRQREFDADGNVVWVQKGTA
jgi:hypothetical protein